MKPDTEEPAWKVAARDEKALLLVGAACPFVPLSFAVNQNKDFIGTARRKILFSVCCISNISYWLEERIPLAPPTQLLLNKFLKAWNTLDNTGSVLAKPFYLRNRFSSFPLNFANCKQERTISKPFQLVLENCWYKMCLFYIYMEYLSELSSKKHMKNLRFLYT